MPSWKTSDLNPHPVIRVIEDHLPLGAGDVVFHDDTRLNELGFSSLEVLQVFVAMEAELDVELEALEALAMQGPIAVGDLVRLHDETSMDSESALHAESSLGAHQAA